MMYTDNSPKVCAWVEELVRQGCLPDGRVDCRSVDEVDKTDETTHWFCGIGGWPLALEMAGWTGPVWTGSCPCQPFSAAGKRKGTDDERHVWPAWLRQIEKFRPPTIFGEQVASRLGREWFAGVRADLEALGYAVGAADLCAASAGAPHIRQRLFWVADANGGQSGDGRVQPSGQHGQQQEDCGVVRLADSAPQRIDGSGDAGPSRRGEHSDGGRLGHADSRRLEVERFTEHGDEQGEPRYVSDGHGTRGWRDGTAINCSDGKARRTESGVRPLAHGVQHRPSLLRGYGNAIVPQIAATFVRAFMEVSDG